MATPERVVTNPAPVAASDSPAVKGASITPDMVKTDPMMEAELAVVLEMAQFRWRIWRRAEISWSLARRRVSDVMREEMRADMEESEMEGRSIDGLSSSDSDKDSILNVAKKWGK